MKDNCVPHSCIIPHFTPIGVVLRWHGLLKVAFTVVNCNFAKITVDSSYHFVRHIDSALMLRLHDNCCKLVVVATFNSPCSLRMRFAHIFDGFFQLVYCFFALSYFNCLLIVLEYFCYTFLLNCGTCTVALWKSNDIHLIFMFCGMIILYCCCCLSVACCCQWRDTFQCICFIIERLGQFLRRFSFIYFIDLIFEYTVYYFIANEMKLFIFIHIHLEIVRRMNCEKEKRAQL